MVSGSSPLERRTPAGSQIDKEKHKVVAWIGLAHKRPDKGRQNNMQNEKALQVGLFESGNS